MTFVLQASQIVRNHNFLDLGVIIIAICLAKAAVGEVGEVLTGGLVVAVDLHPEVEVVFAEVGREAGEVGLWRLKSFRKLLYAFLFFAFEH